MVKLSAISLAVVCALSPLAEAAACKNGLYYCGYNLLKKGKYQNEMIAENKRLGAPTDKYSLWYSLYYCGAGGDGWIRYITTCDQCVDGGSGKNDYCRLA
ncbi:hypothetical protein N657DRAFT_571789 [Parathielavia appendiculata]|uniref:Uncharacterized protein n=1 Tax=Parathielavia appendiculata TaxID=2587402 RepID=A0AAN6U130_9PEZI|nr:hypothetical protein N657DRAFT_571789 [Parathielavia appendiculata]